LAGTATGVAALVPSTSASGGQRSNGEGVFTLTPGERLIIEGKQAPQVDRPSLDSVTAWQRGQIALDSTPLADAVAEMNRYSTIRLIVEDPRAAAIRISGVFRVGDSEDFAQAVARTYHLQLRNDLHGIVLVGPAAVSDRAVSAPR
jgi:transmembrane sensor